MTTPLETQLADALGNMLRDYGNMNSVDGWTLHPDRIPQATLIEARDALVAYHESQAPAETAFEGFSISSERLLEWIENYQPKKGEA